MKTHREKLIDNIIKTQAHLDLIRIGFAQKNNELWQLLLETKDGEDEIRTGLFERIMLLSLLVDEAEVVAEQARDEYRDYLVELDTQSAEEQKAELERVKKMYEDMVV